MQKVFDTYAQRKGIQASSLRFLLDGEKIGAEQTPKMLELDDQDQIDCMLEQVRRVLYGNWNDTYICIISYQFIIKYSAIWHTI